MPQTRCAMLSLHMILSLVRMAKSVLSKVIRNSGKSLHNSICCRPQARAHVDLSGACWYLITTIKTRDYFSVLLIP